MTDVSPDHAREDPLRTIWRRFRRGGELRPLMCLTATVALGLVLAGLGVAGGWLVGMTHENLGATFVLGLVREQDVRTGLFIAGIVWLASLVWIWRPAVRLNRHSLGAESRRQWVRPIAITVFAGALVTVLSYVIGRKPWDRTDYLVTAVTLVAGGVAVVFWLPTVFRLEQGRPILGRHGRVNVHCVECGYSMAGLRETVCPECGRTYTVDELILVQDYETRRGRREDEPEPKPETEPATGAAPRVTPPPAP